MKIPSIPQLYRHVTRWREILAVLSKYGLAGWISRTSSDFAKNLLRDRDGALARHSRETRIRLALTELGPTFIKFGQILSTRPDLVGAALADELRKLQDEVPADPPRVVCATIEAELGRPLTDLFSQFDTRPLASASIGQVHRVRMRCGQAVVVKVQHARIEDTINVDLDILAGLAQLAEHVPELANYRPRATVAEFQRILRRELDFGREKRNLQQFARDFAGDPCVRIPRTYPELSTSRVLTMEQLEGVKLTEVHRGNSSHLDARVIAQRGADLYLEMIFTHGFYHADPHPGNILLMPGNVIGLVDFGMVGRIDEALREDVEEMLWAIGHHDATRLTALIIRVGSAPDDMDAVTLGLDLADFLAHYTNQPLDQLDLSSALLEIMEMIRRYHIMLPARIAMLFKVLIMLEGTSRLLYPKFSLMELLQPYQKKLLWRRLSPTRRLRKMRRMYADLEQLVEVLPRRVMDITHQLQSGKFDVHLEHRGLEPSVNRMVLGLLASALFLGSSLLLRSNVPPHIGGLSLLGICGYVVSLALGLRLLRAITKSGHLDRRRAKSLEGFRHFGWSDRFFITLVTIVIAGPTGYLDVRFDDAMR